MSSDTESIVALFADAATPPPDLTLAALERVILASPGEDTPVLEYIDRCRELNLDALANLVEADLELKRHRREQKAKKPPTYLEAMRTFYNGVVKALGIPAHVLDGTKESPATQSGDSKTPWPIAPPEPLPPYET